ncbi:uncharacterized protein LOC111118109 [Crassostrea virginica]
MERGLVICALVVLCLNSCCSFLCCSKAGKCYLCKLPTVKRTVIGPPPIKQRVSCKTVEECSIKRLMIRNHIDQLMEQITLLRSKGNFGNTVTSKRVEPKPQQPVRPKPEIPDINKLLGATPHQMGL